MLESLLTPQQLEVISALSTGATLTAAAEEAGVHRNTINHWRRNLLPFQDALASAHYDRALLVREKMEAQVDLAVKAIHDLLADPKTPASIRLKAALAVIQLAATPPAPKKQIELEVQKVVLDQPESQPEPQPQPKPAPVHNSAQSTPIAIRRIDPPTTGAKPGPKPGRNELCPCGSGKKFKRCCLGRPLTAAA